MIGFFILAGLVAWVIVGFAFSCLPEKYIDLLDRNAFLEGLGWLIIGPAVIAMRITQHYIKRLR